MLKNVRRTKTKIQIEMLEIILTPKILGRPISGALGLNLFSQNIAFDKKIKIRIL